MSENKKTLLSGIKPTGAPHLGNYFGAIKQLVELQGQFEKVYVFVADYHALNVIKDPQELKEGVKNIVKTYIACGLDPEKIVIYKQSDIPEHTELAWIFNTMTTMPYLMRAHAFKDAEAKNKEINVGTFDYPILMAADILLYEADVVPVGQDQKQHIEIARDLVDKFVSTYGQSPFKKPEALIPEKVSVVPGVDGQKMSKSYNNTIPLLGTKEEIEKAVMSIVTDSSGDVPENVFAIHKLFFENESELASLYEKNKGSYKVLKEALVEDIEKLVAPMREKYGNISDEEISNILEKGRELAKEKASETLGKVKSLIGVTQ